MADIPPRRVVRVSGDMDIDHAGELRTSSAGNQGTSCGWRRPATRC